MEQSAVEWLEEQFNNGDIPFGSTLLKQAKEMEKEQIVDAYRFGISDEYVIGAEQYYNETFKSE